MPGGSVDLVGMKCNTVTSFTEITATISAAEVCTPRLIDIPTGGFRDGCEGGGGDRKAENKCFSVSKLTWNGGGVRVDFISDLAQG